jgi:hypothetical protein
MPRNGSGQYNLPYDWNDDKANGIKVLASRMQAQDEDIGTALTGSLAADGQTPLTGDLDFNNNKSVDLADGSDLGDAINVSQSQTGETQFYGVSTTTPAGTNGEDYDVAAFATISAYPAYVRFSFICHFTCIVNPNLRINALATKILKKSNGASGYTALVAGDMVADKEYIAVYNEDINSTDIIIENPESAISQSNDLIENLAVTTSVATNALTIAIKTAAGNDPSSNDSVSIAFRSSTATSGSYNIRDVVAATSLVVSSGSTLGSVSGIAANLYVYAIDNAGTVEMAVSSSIYPDNSIQSTTAEGGAGAADSATALYSTTARSNVPIRLIGTVNITEATAGTWSLNATTVTSAPIGNIASRQGSYLISSQTASSSASIAFTNLSSQFSTYEFELVNVLPANNGAAMAMQLSTDNGSTWINANYLTDGQVTISDATNVEAQSSATRINLQIYEADAGLCPSNTANRGGVSGFVTIFNLASSTIYKYGILNTTTSRSNTSGMCNATGNLRYEGATTAINAVRFIFKTFNSDVNNGNIASGIIKMRGYI